MKTYLVGGAVRDKLLKYPHHENDWVVVGATAQQLIDLGFQPVGRDFPVFLHPVTKDEYALARTERKTGPGYTGFDCYTSPDVTLEEDLVRRDLTINAMAEDEDGTIVDPYNGRRDLEAKVLRHVSPAFVEDPLRVLRVARFAARYAHLGFSVAPETIALMRTIADSGELSALPGERIWKELERALGEQTPQQFFAVLEQCGALHALLPELQGLTPRTFAALQLAAESEQPTPVRFAVLFIDLGETESERAYQTVKAPNEYRHLAQLVNRHASRLDTALHDSARVADLLTALDAFRKPQRFEQFLQCIELLFPQGNNPDLLRRAFAACQQIDPKAIVAQGLKGKAINEELRRQRIAAVELLLPK